MISNKNQLKNALKLNKDGIKIKRIYNFDKNNKIQVGDIANIMQVQSNAFTIKFERYEQDAWVYYDNIEVKDNKIYYYQYISDENIEEKVRELGVEIIKIEKEDKINKDVGKTRNYYYISKFIVMINEIIEI